MCASDSRSVAAGVYTRMVWEEGRHVDAAVVAEWPVTVADTFAEQTEGYETADGRPGRITAIAFAKEQACWTATENGNLTLLFQTKVQ